MFGLPLVIITSPLLMGQPATHIVAAPIADLPEVQIVSPLADSPEATLISSTWSLSAIQGTTSELPEGEVQAEDDHAEDEPMHEIVVQGTFGPTEGDPMERMNANTYRITQDVDKAVVAPLAYAYEDGLPGPLRDGLHNAVRNLGEPSNALNFLLQLKIGKAFETLGRFAINSTLGIGGLFDIAGEPGIGLPYRKNGFANTLGFYGVDAGPYLVLPLAGSTSVRDVIGNGLDSLLLPTAIGGPFRDPEVGIPVFVVSSLQARLEVDEQLDRINSSDDPYAAMRDGYLAQRKATIQEFREGSPLQGIPDADRPDGERLTPMANDPALDPDETPAENESADRNVTLEGVGSQFEPGRIVLVQTRKSHPTR